MKVIGLIIVCILIFIGIACLGVIGKVLGFIAELLGDLFLGGIHGCVGCLVWLFFIFIIFSVLLAAFQ